MASCALAASVLNEPEATACDGSDDFVSGFLSVALVSALVSAPDLDVGARPPAFVAATAADAAPVVAASATSFLALAEAALAALGAAEAEAIAETVAAALGAAADATGLES